MEPIIKNTTAQKVASKYKSENNFFSYENTAENGVYIFEIEYC